MTYIGKPFIFDESSRAIGTSLSGINFQTIPPKSFKLGFIVGRFQHIHLGHEFIINKALQVVDKVIVLVGSAQASGTPRNPFHINTRLELIQEIFKSNKNVIIDTIDDMTDETDNCFAWGRFVLERVVEVGMKNGINYNPDIIISGVEEVRRDWYDPKDIENVSQIYISKSNVNTSATEIRKLMAEKNFWKWREYVNPLLHPKFNDLREELLYVTEYYKIIPEWEKS